MNFLVQQTEIIMAEEGQTLHRMAWQRWKARLGARMDLFLPSHSAASKSSRFEWKRESMPLGTRKVSVWIRYNSGKPAVDKIQRKEERSFLHRAPSATSHTTDADIFGSFGARNIIAAAAARRAESAVVNVEPGKRSALKDRPVTVSAGHSTAKPGDWRSTKKGKSYKRERTPQRKSFRLATREVKTVVESSEEEFSDSSDSS